MCLKCGEVKPIDEFYFNEKKGKTSNHCLECHRSPKNWGREDYRTIEGRSYMVLNTIRWKCRNKGIPFNLTREWLVDKYRLGKYEVTGLPLDFTLNPYQKTPKAFAPSLDRLDPEKGYTKANTRLVCWIYNRAKGIDTPETLDILVKALADNKN